MIEVFVLSLWP